MDLGKLELQMYQEGGKGMGIPAKLLEESAQRKLCSSGECGTGCPGSKGAPEEQPRES